MYFVALCFTRRADSFRGFVGTLVDLNLGQSYLKVLLRDKPKLPTNGFIADWNNIGLSRWDLLKIC
jgi:hypothetical protein